MPTGTPRVREFAATALGKLARFATRLRGGGSSFPGKLAARIDPGYLTRASGKLPHGVISVLGSNGKTTTTTMLTRMLREHGLRVISNPAGSNMPQGLVTSMVQATGLSGRVPYDVAVLETDEGYTHELGPQLNPTASLLLNVQVDQLQRLHEPDKVGDMLREMALHTDGHVIINADSPHLVPIADELTHAVPHFFGVDPGYAATLPHGLSNAADFRGSGSDTQFVLESTVLSSGERSARIRIGNDEIDVALPARGLHYAIDVAAAALTAKSVLGDRFDPQAVVRAMATAKTAFGRGEVMRVGEEDIEMVMFKNGPSLQLNLDAMPEIPEQILFTIDTGTPDLTWLYAADLSRIERIDVLSGELHAPQLAVFFAYNEIVVDRVEPRMQDAVRAFLALPKPSRGVKTMFVNYEQMSYIREELGFHDKEGRA